MNKEPDETASRLDSEKQTEELNRHQSQSDIPLFLRDGSEDKKGDAQDEKDRTEE